ncbi:MAG TPA: RIP metalloprotease RseP [Rhodocyclaceae bacterium]|nr:RIP metalloprotease RseP [Rhodocyclaceae bacterium]
MSPGNFAFTLAAFALALGTLIVVHEFGHYVVARAIGVKVLRFSLGFGRPLWLKRLGRDRTEWAIAAFPLGGYVKMLDEREGPVAAHELPRAFNRQPVGKRLLVVAAGPLANLLLAILIYWLLFMHGTEALRPLLAAPPAATAAAAAGLKDGDAVRAVDGKRVMSWEEMRWELIQSALSQPTVTLEVENQQHEIALRRLDTSALNAADPAPDLPQQLGLLPYRPPLPPVVGEVTKASVAEQAGIRVGDRFTAVAGQPVSDWREVAMKIRASPGRLLSFDLLRQGRKIALQARPAAVEEGGRRIGRLGIVMRDDPTVRAEMLTTVRYGVLPALGHATRQTWSTSVLTLTMIGRMISGEASWKNLSGPVTIADYAGQSAKLGWTHYLSFLALISISLGVLNLLPIPILDGGHLLYYMVEIIKGGPLPERVMEIGQQIGLGLLIMLMAFAFYNDINRLVSG